MIYAAKKIFTLFLTVITVSFLTFVAFSLISGDPAAAMLGTEATEEALEAVREEYGLNKPLLERYAIWVLGFFTGDLGISYSYKLPVWELIAPKMLVTLTLSLLSFAIIVAVSIPIGIALAGTESKTIRAIEALINQICMAVPSFFTGILLTWLFCLVLKWFKHGSFPGLSQDFWGSVSYMLYGAVSIAIPRIASTVRMLKSTVSGELKKDYVRTSVARGADKKTILYRHVLKNSLTPTVTFLAQTMAEIIAGGIVVEQVFAIPGLGRLLVASISNRDYPVVEAIIVIVAFWVVALGTAADLINMGIDPRIRLGGAE